jgi:hypothetical protein
MILNTDDALFEALGYLQQAELLIAAVRAQDPDSYALCDGHSLLQDAVSQIRGELTERTEGKAA